ncbi:MAG: hypothetical protein INR71_00120 [Terriglobus roseus]|nr:hypothetical protein [Terriglobus roseus]
MPVNGTYAPHNTQPFAPTEQNLAAHSANSAGYGAPSSNNASNPAEAPSVEEVGWYFVERYYTTMSKKPDNLFVCCCGPRGRRLANVCSSSTTSAHAPSSGLRTRRLPSASVKRYAPSRCCLCERMLMECRRSTRA